MRWKLFAVGLSAYIIALIATAPATLIDAGLQRASTGRLRLAEAQGTLWSGAGQIEIRDAKGRTGAAKNLAWRVLPASLLSGRLVYEIEPDQSAKRFPVTISLSRIQLTDFDINLPAAVLGLAVPKLAPLELTGDMLLHVANLTVGHNEAQGAATLQWRAAASALTAVSPLGDYELRFERERSMTHARLRTLHGPLQLDGEGSWANDSSPLFTATARIPRQYQQQLAPLLRLIAVERGDGSFALELK